MSYLLGLAIFFAISFNTSTLIPAVSAASSLPVLFSSNLLAHLMMSFESQSL